MKKKILIPTIAVLLVLALGLGYWFSRTGRTGPVMTAAQTAEEIALVCDFFGCGALSDYEGAFSPIGKADYTCDIQNHPYGTTMTLTFTLTVEGRKAEGELTADVTEQLALDETHTLLMGDWHGYIEADGSRYPLGGDVKKPLWADTLYATLWVDGPVGSLLTFGTWPLDTPELEALYRSALE